MKPYATAESRDAIEYQRCPALAAVECHVLRYIGGKSKEVGRASDVRQVAEFPRPKPESVSCEPSDIRATDV